MAFSDDNFDVLELQMLHNFAKDRGVSKEDLEKILLEPSQVSTIPTKIEKKIEYLYDLAIMIWADGVVTDDEVNTLKKYCLKFGFLKENIADLSDFLLKKAKEKTNKEDLIQQILNQL